MVPFNIRILWFLSNYEQEMSFIRFRKLGLNVISFNLQLLTYQRNEKMHRDNILYIHLALYK